MKMYKQIFMKKTIQVSSMSSQIYIRIILYVNERYIFISALFFKAITTHIYIHTHLYPFRFLSRGKQLAYRISLCVTRIYVLFFLPGALKMISTVGRTYSTSLPAVLAAAFPLSRMGLNRVERRNFSNFSFINWLTP